MNPPPFVFGLGTAEIAILIFLFAGAPIAAMLAKPGVKALNAGGYALTWFGVFAAVLVGDAAHRGALLHPGKYPGAIYWSGGLVIAILGGWMLLTHPLMRRLKAKVVAAEGAASTNPVKPAQGASN